MFLWFYLILHWIDCGIVYLCFHISSSCCIGLIVTLLTCVLLVQPYVAWIDCGIVYLCYHGSSSCCIWLIVILFIYVLMVLPHVALDWLWHCLSVFSWFILMLHCIDCNSVYLCSYGSSSCCIGSIVTLFIYFLLFFLQLHWIDSDIVFLCSYGSNTCCLGLIVTLFVFVLVVLPHVALDSLLHCLSLFLWFFLMLHWIDCDIVFLCSYGSTSCCIELSGIVYLCFHGSSSCCIWLIVKC